MHLRASHPKPRTRAFAARSAVQHRRNRSRPRLQHLTFIEEEAIQLCCRAHGAKYTSSCCRGRINSLRTIAYEHGARQKGTGTRAGETGPPVWQVGAGCAESYSHAELMLVAKIRPENVSTTPRSRTRRTACATRSPCFTSAASCGMSISLLRRAQAARAARRTQRRHERRPNL